MRTETNLLKRVMYHAQEFNAELRAIQLTTTTSQEKDLKKLLTRCAEELSTRIIGLFPGQVSIRKLFEYNKLFEQTIPGYANRNAIKYPSGYARIAVLRFKDLIDAIIADLKNPKIKLPWLIEHTGNLIIRHGTVRGRLISFLSTKSNNLDQAFI